MIISFIIPGIPYNEAVRYSFHIYHFIIVPSVILFCSLIQTSGLNRQRDSTKVSCICNKTSDTSAKRSSHLQKNVRNICYKTFLTFATNRPSHLQQNVRHNCHKTFVVSARKFGCKLLLQKCEILFQRRLWCLQIALKIVPKSRFEILWRQISRREGTVWGARVGGW